MKNKLHMLPRKRRRRSKTNYKKRLRLLKSGRPRLVVRKTNTKIIAQIVDYKPDGDKVITTTYSSDLSKLGWKGSYKNTPAAYLTGLLVAKKAKELKVGKVILDIGLHTPVKGSLVLSVAKGAIDGGINLPASEKVFPDQKRINGEHLKSEVQKQFKQIHTKLVGLK